MAAAPEIVSLSLLGLVANGEFNSIFVAQQASQPGVVVVKVLNHAAHGNEDAAQRLLNERALLETVSSRPHPFVVGFRFAMVDATFAYLGMENVGGGDLFSLLQRHGPFPPEAAKMYVAEVALALAHLHSFDIVHRDVKVRSSASAPNAATLPALPPAPSRRPTVSRVF
jgi:serine/threonine protein kinase